MDPIKSKLLKKNRKVAQKFTIENDGASLELDIVKPTIGDILKLAEEAKLAGDLDEKGKPTSELAALRVAARQVVAFAYMDGQPYFSKDDIEALAETEYVLDMSKAVQSVIELRFEDLRGN